MRQPKVLLITASFGNGHNQVSRVLKHAFEEFGIGNVEVCDLYAEAYPHWNEIAKFLYKQAFTIGPSLYKKFFYFMDKRYGTTATKWYMRLGEKKLEHILEEKKPDIIITTFPVGTVPELRKTKSYKFQLYTVVTDYCLHRTWVHEEIDRYYVATEAVKQKLCMNGVPAENIRVSGIPIRKEFEYARSRSRIMEKYKISPDYKKVLIVAGAQGVVKHIGWIAERLLEDPAVQLLIVCGRNEKLYQQLAVLQPFYGSRLQVFAYVEKIHELYEAADIMITKPGGITLSEAVAKKLPTVLYKPVPGQEQENSVFFNQAGAAVVLRNKEEVVRETLSLLHHTNRLQNMKYALEDLHKAGSSVLITSDILQFFRHAHV
ncbi:MGDG synthase family glycosyltransferase [Ectobacillus ponti]|uniref:Glycosyltransferase n=1 Tax=Ectobacillus ponti TaxID=2961894 RepID=A0AA42BQD8_9BACI|nr:glycosyltransferase [Ectobacillus ponti]MCP8969296.1 glycosyltransferase [Ectobacillus ponti]